MANKRQLQQYGAVSIIVGFAVIFTGGSIWGGIGCFVAAALMLNRARKEV